MNSDSILAGIADRVNEGFKIFPCFEKKPLTDRGFYDASNDFEQIRTWWQKYPNAQIGAPTGAVNHFVVLDVDGADGARWVSEKPMPATREVETRPGRKQYWFHLPEGKTLKNSAGVLAPEVDIRGDGGYTICPPSIHHESGKPYRFINNLPLALAPQWLFEAGNSKRAALQPSGQEFVIQQGQGRHREALKLAGGLRARGMNAESILAALQIFSQQHCVPPLELVWMEKTSRYIERKPPNFRGQNTETSAEIELESFSEVVLEKVDWLWKNRIAKRKLNLFVGHPSAGKSVVTTDIAARASNGRDFPNGDPCEACDTIILSAEDGASDTILPRLRAAGADTSRIHRIKAVRVTLGDGTSKDSGFDLGRDLEKLEEVCRKNPRIGLIILDPLSAYLGETNSWRDSEVRALLTPLIDFATRALITIIAILHLKKSESDALLRVGGSIAFVAAARVVLGFGEHPDNPAQRVMVSVKNNLAALAPAIAYEIASTKEDVPYVVWGNQQSTVNADEVLGMNSKERSDRAEKLGTAVDWLRAQLAAAPAPQEQLEKAAEGAGFSWRTIRRAKDKLGVKSHKAGFGGAWYWELPDSVQEGGQDLLQ